MRGFLLEKIMTLEANKVTSIDERNSTLVDPRVVYDKKWRTATGGLYTEGVEGKSTPLLDALSGRLSTRGVSLTALEVAAGSGDHAIILATQLPGTQVVAIDSSPAATDRIRERVPEHRLATGSCVEVVTGDVFEFLRTKSSGSVDAAHANSFVHFLSIAEREQFYQDLHAVQTSDGLIAVSLKADGDALFRQSGTRVIGEDVRGVYALPEDGIQRLFVKDTEPLAEELHKVGYRVIDTLRWRIPGYDIPGQDGEFVGILAQRR